MRLDGKVVVVTGGASGIGKALCLRFAAAGARGIVVADRVAEGAETVAREVGGLAVSCDVGVEAEVGRLVARATEAFGPIDLFCSNAGVLGLGDQSAPDEVWDQNWRVNVMAHVFAARALVPAMRARGFGYLLATASAAGLLTQIGGAPYAVTKHAAVAFAEWLAITYHACGIRVSCLCPLGVLTNMLHTAEGPIADYLRSTSLDPAAVADAVIAGLATERFLILSHPEAGEFFRRKADDYERWLNGMRRLQARLHPGGEPPLP